MGESTCHTPLPTSSSMGSSPLCCLEKIPGSFTTGLCTDCSLHLERSSYSSFHASFKSDSDVTVNEGTLINRCTYLHLLVLISASWLCNVLTQGKWREGHSRTLCTIFATFINLKLFQNKIFKNNKKFCFCQHFLPPPLPDLSIFLHSTHLLLYQ